MYVKYIIIDNIQIVRFTARGVRIGLHAGSSCCVNFESERHKNFQLKQQRTHTFIQSKHII